MAVDSVNLNKVIQTLQQYTVFRGLSYLLYAGLWLYYLQHLLNPHKQNAEYCRDVQPTLRSVLLVFAWIKLVVSILFVGMVLSSLLVKPTIELFVFVLAVLVIIGVFLYQIQYLNAVEQSSARTDHCDDIESQKRLIIYVFTVVTFVFGVVLVLFGATGRSFIEHMVDAAVKKK